MTVVFTVTVLMKFYVYNTLARKFSMVNIRTLSRASVNSA